MSYLSVCHRWSTLSVHVRLGTWNRLKGYLSQAERLPTYGQRFPVPHSLPDDIRRLWSHLSVDWCSKSIYDSSDIAFTYRNTCFLPVRHTFVPCLISESSPNRIQLISFSLIILYHTLKTSLQCDDLAIHCRGVVPISETSPSTNRETESPKFPDLCLLHHNSLSLSFNIEIISSELIALNSFTSMLIR